MSRFARFFVLIAALTSLFAVTSSSAGAVTWTNTGNTAVHATGVGGGLHVGSNTLSCTGATATGTAPAGGGSTYSVTGNVTYSPCSLVGQSTTVHCSIALTASFHIGGIFGGSTSLSIDVSCDVKLTFGSIGLCHISGSTPGSYINPSAAGGTGRLTLNTSSTLVVSNFGSTSCPLGTGPGTLTHQALTTTVGATPIITTDP
jgi:hypothetical protein